MVEERMDQKPAGKPGETKPAGKEVSDADKAKQYVRSIVKDVLKEIDEKKEKEEMTMTDEGITKFDVLRDKIDNLKEGFNKEIQEVRKGKEDLGRELLKEKEELGKEIQKGKEEFGKEIHAVRQDTINSNKELEKKVIALDDKQCKDGECLGRIEKTQTEMFKDLMDRLKVLEEPVYVCSSCGVGTMRRGATQCPFCGVKVKSWN